MLITIMQMGYEAGEQDPAHMGRSAEAQKATHEEVDGVLEGAISAFNFGKDIPHIGLDQGNIMGISNPSEDVTVWKFVLDPGPSSKLVVIARQHGKLSGLIHEAASYQRHGRSAVPHRTRYDTGHTMRSDEAQELLAAMKPIAERRNSERKEIIRANRPRVFGRFIPFLREA